MGEKTGKFTVREVEDRTGVPSSSLRQWERRYGFPAPQRSASGYRYYSENDLAAVIRIRDLVADGVPPSRASSMVREAAVEQPGARSPEVLSRELNDALLSLQSDRAERVLSEALGLHPLDTVLLEVMQPALVRIGDGWHAGEVSVATEHFASNLLQGRLRGLLRMLGSAGAGPTAVVACVPGEQHEMGSLVLAIMLRRAGFKVIFLGADTPLPDLVKLAELQQADVVMISVTGRGKLGDLVREGGQLRDLPGLLVLGGQAVAAQPSVAAELGGVFLGNDLRKVIPELTSLLGRSRNR